MMKTSYLDRGCPRPLLKRWLAFNLVGLIGIVVQVAVLAGLTHVPGCHYLVATAAAVEVAVLHNFVWHERWTWAERARGGRLGMLGRLTRFHLTNGALSLAGNVLLMRLFVGEFAMNYSAANLAAITTCSMLNFFAGDRLVFVGGVPDGVLKGLGGGENGRA
jgi:putative flippase GtrA